MKDELLIRLFSRHFADPVAALQRFEANLASVGLPMDVKAQLRELCFPPQPELPDGLPSFIYYFVPETRRGSDRVVPADPLHPSFVNACDGIGLNLGCPVRLLRALDALAQLSPEDQREPRAALQNAPQHLSAVEELLWLTVWKSPTRLSRGGRFAGMAGDVDWALCASGYPVFLEAKFRQSDWPRLSDGDSFVQMGQGFLSNAEHKFPVTRPLPALHIVGATIFEEVTEDVVQVVALDLKATPQVDAVVFRSLSQVMDVVSLYPDLTDRVVQLLDMPRVSDFPVHNLFFHIEQRDARLSQRSVGGPAGEGAPPRAFASRLRPSGRFSFPIPERGAYRLSIPSRGHDGEPHFNIIPKYLMTPEA